MSEACFILNFTNISAADHHRVGGKCASLGDMTQAGFNVPPGFAVTTDAYQQMLAHNGLREEIVALLDTLDVSDVTEQERVSQAIQVRFRSHSLPGAVEQAIRDSYAHMDNIPVAVRSSAT
ncbi:MAG: PEP/pyruvate-binding domain-containing protein, partial [Thiolinea sp.]